MSTQSQISKFLKILLIKPYYYSNYSNNLKNAEDSLLRGRGFKLPLRWPFFTHLDQKRGAKRDNWMFRPAWHCCMHWKSVFVQLAFSSYFYTNVNLSRTYCWHNVFQTWKWTFSIRSASLFRSPDFWPRRPESPARTRLSKHLLTDLLSWSRISLKVQIVIFPSK